MREGWSYKKLGEVCESDLGKTLNQSKDTGELRPYLCAVNILWDKIDFTTLKQTRFKKDELERYSVRKGDLLVCEGGDIGRAAIWNSDEPIQYQNALHRIRFNGEVLPRFCLLYLRHLKQNGTLDTKYGKGVTILHLVKSSLLSIPIPVPPLSTQQKIVEELDLLSGIIEKQKAQLKELDSLAQSLFYDMFGDPVTNEKGWEVKKFGVVYKLKSGDGLSSKQFIEGPYPVYGGNGVAGCHVNYNKDGDYIIIGRVGVYCGNVRNVKGKFWLTDNAFQLFYDENKQSPIFVTYLLNFLDLHQYANHAAQPVISNITLKDVSIIFPPLPLQQQFAERVASIEHQKTLIQQQLKETETLFNSRMDYYFN